MFIELNWNIRLPGFENLNNFEGRKVGTTQNMTKSMIQKVKREEYYERVRMKFLKEEFKRELFSARSSPVKTVFEDDTEIKVEDAEAVIKLDDSADMKESIDA